MIQPKQLTYFDWTEATKEVRRLSGKDPRNWAGKSFDVNNLNNTKPYLDFWHEFIGDHEYFIHNGGYVPVNFEDIIQDIVDFGTPEDQWTAEVYKLYQQVVGGLEEATFYISW